MEDIRVLIKEFLNSWIECDSCHYMIRQDLIEPGDNYIHVNLCYECNNIYYYHF